MLNLKEKDLIFLILFFQFYTRENFSCIKGEIFNQQKLQNLNPLQH